MGAGQGLINPVQGPLFFGYMLQSMGVSIEPLTDDHAKQCKMDGESCLDPSSPQPSICHYTTPDIMKKSLDAKLK